MLHRDLEIDSTRPNSRADSGHDSRRRRFIRRDVISRVSLTVVDTAEARKLDIVISVAAARLSIRWPSS